MPDEKISADDLRQGRAAADSASTGVSKGHDEGFNEVELPTTSPNTPTEIKSNDRRELFRSSNGDAWFLGRDPSDGRAVVIHEANRPSGGQVTVIDLGSFLSYGNGPEQQALLRLIATLVDVPPYSERQGS